MTMSPRLRKLALVTHIAVAVGWIGAVAGYLALDVAAATSPDAETLRAAYLAMELIARYVIVPLTSSCLWEPSGACFDTTGSRSRSC
jgi:hypothetical protein